MYPCVFLRPQLGDYAILLRSGFTLQQALKSQLLTSAGWLAPSFSNGSSRGLQLLTDPTCSFFVCTSLLGVLFGLAMDVTRAAHFILPFVAGGFLYIALVDLMPDFLRPVPNRHALWDIVAIVSGIICVLALILCDSH